MAWFFATFQKELSSAALSIVVAIVLFIFRSRAKILWSSPHSFNFLIKNTDTEVLPTLLVHTASVFILNAGRIPATDVEIMFNFKPENFNIWPVRSYDTIVNPDGRFTIKLPNIAPKESFQIELLSIPKLPDVINIKKQGVRRKTHNHETISSLPPFSVCYYLAVNLFWNVFLFLYNYKIA